jgi:3',5'-cyclic-AMP phosphodiesterase
VVKAALRFSPVAALALAACLLASSCRYGLGELFGRDDPVSHRLDQSSARDAVLAGQRKTLEQAVPASTAFSFIVATDLHFDCSAWPRASDLAAFAKLAKDSGADFAIFGGDLADAGKEEEYKLFAAFADSLKSGPLSHLGEGAALPWFAAVGNHDLYNSGWRFFAQYAGSSTDRFKVGSSSFYIVDSGSGTLGETQLERLGAAMESDAAPKIVVSHYPVRGSSSFSYYRITNTRERAELLSLFNENSVKLLICGHWHKPEDDNCGSFEERLPGSLSRPETGDKSRAAVVKVASDGSIQSFAVTAF